MVDITELAKALGTDVETLAAEFAKAAPAADQGATFAASTEPVETPAEAGFVPVAEHDIATAEAVVDDAQTVSSDVQSGQIVPAVAAGGDLLAEVHAMVSEIYTLIKDLEAKAPEIVKAVESLPMVGGMFAHLLG